MCTIEDNEVYLIKKDGTNFVYKPKEYYVVRYIIDKFKQYNWQINKKFKNTRIRLDMLLELDDRIITIEIDENQHKSYKNNNERIYKMGNGFFYKNIFIIRFNPDKYVNNDKKYSSCWNKENNYYVISDKQQLT